MTQHMRPYSIVIPTYNNKSVKQSSLITVLKCLRSSADCIEQIIVVDNGSTDGGVNIEGLSSLPIEVHSCNLRNNRAAARNAGLSHCRAKYVVMMDDDILLPGGMLADLFASLNEDSFFTCAERRFLPLDLPSEQIERAAEENDTDWMRKASFKYPGTDTPDGNWMAMLRFTFVACFGIVPLRSLREIGGFRESYAGWGLEDTDLMVRLMGKMPLISLFQKQVVFHRDHYISPYIVSEYRANNEHFKRQQANDETIFDVEKFGQAIMAGKSNINLRTLK